MFNLAHPLIFLAIATFPLYLLPSGGVQLSHLFFVLFLVAFARPLMRYHRHIPAKQKEILKGIFVFSFFVVCVQLIAAAYYAEIDFIIYAAFYVFNLCYTYACFVYIRAFPKQGIYWVFAGVLAAIVLAALGVAAGISSGPGRAAGFFNNPNQLGYFGVTAMALLLTFHARQKTALLSWVTLGFMAIAFWLTTASLSKAAMVASAISVVMFVTTFKRAEIFSLCCFALLASPFVADKIRESDQYQSVLMRLQSIGYDHDDSLSARGYSRALQYPQYLLLGAGEGNYKRFGTKYEIHSTFANIVFSYGIVGFVLFGLVLLNMFRLSPMLFMVMFTGVFVYGITHNGIRSSFFWLLVSLFLAVADQTQLFGKPALANWARSFQRIARQPATRHRWSGVNQG